MKKSILAILFVCIMVFVFTSCKTQAVSGSSLAQPHSQISVPSNTASDTVSKDGTMLNKLRQIKSDWTEQQVYALLGEPDKYGERSVVYDAFYTVNPTTEATISFWSEGIEIIVFNSETGERTTILGRNQK